VVTLKHLQKGSRQLHEQLTKWTGIAKEWLEFFNHDDFLDHSRVRDRVTLTGVQLLDFLEGVDEAGQEMREDIRRFYAYARALFDATKMFSLEVKMVGPAGTPPEVARDLDREKEVEALEASRGWTPGWVPGPGPPPTMKDASVGPEPCLGRDQ